ncbi:hypothetical protein BKA70DRAFT_339252 [Coprinopsis sp. MPI-PUGE-AT-0042]|nr:hypothetical protein BKA70DRAFT_339252 [Coprinopsis sp. MPI-PUGE-AT-0042]
MLIQTPEETRAQQIKSQALINAAHELNEQKRRLLQQVRDVDRALALTLIEYGAVQNSSVYINRVPSEILCLIFSYCLSTPNLTGAGNYVSGGERPAPEVTLSHVCQHWRQMALGYPQLWSSFRYRTRKWRRDPINRLHAYLDRSNPLCIDLHISLKGAPHEDMAILDLAAQHVDRWHGLTLVSEDNKFDWSRLQSALCDKSAPNLEYMTFRPSLAVVAGGDHVHVLPIRQLTPKIFRRGAPKLTQIRLDATVPYFFLPPLANVTTLSLDAKYYGPRSISWAAFLDIINLPSLENLSIGGYIIGPPLASDDTGEAIFARNLKHIRWSSDGVLLGFLFSYLDAPCLESAIFCGISLPHDPSPALSTAKANLPSLRSLYIIECGTLSAHFIRFLASASPNLKHLSMSYYQPWEGDLLTYLNRESKNEGRTHWRRLESLTCYLHNVYEVEPYLEFVGVRSERNKEDDRPPLLLRVGRRLFESWEWECEMFGDYRQLKDLCFVEPWYSTSDILPQHWPPGADADPLSNEGSTQFNFAVDWNEL